MTEELGQNIAFSSFLIKVASRCNLACDYCYVYEHVDQTWREQPRTVSAETVRLIGERLAEYVARVGLQRVVIVFHGGEPLLIGAVRLAEIAQQVRAAVPASVGIDWSLQTNGILLDEASLDVLEEAGIAVSLSIDGPREAQDRHRLTVRGRSSFEASLRALKLLSDRPEVFAGVIAVIDPEVEPVELLRFFSQFNIPCLDFLLPDANHDHPPPGRDEEPDRYVRWLVEAFDLWFDAYADLPLRTFDAVLATLAGLPSQTDAFGFGNVSLLSIETDGSYHDLDVLKITEQGRTALGLNLADASFADAARSQGIRAHQLLLKPEGLNSQCRECPELTVCGGGSVPHRFGSGTFDHPTVYCREMLGLIEHARSRMLEAVSQATPRLRSSDDVLDFDAFDRPEDDGAAVVELLLRAFEDEAIGNLVAALSELGDAKAATIDMTSRELRRLAVHPSVVLWSRLRESPTPLRTSDGRPLAFDPSLVGDLFALMDLPEGLPQLHRPDALLRSAFGPPIVFDSESTAVAERSRAGEALALIQQWRPALYAELCLLCPEIQFIRDTSADEDKCVSFSDDLVPGALFVTAHTASGVLDAYNLADSLIHEYRHQKLYLLDRAVTLVEDDSPRYRSPWRDDLRPPSGVLHACFVFVELFDFWKYARSYGAGKASSQASRELPTMLEKLAQGFAVLREAPLTAAGHDLRAVLERRVEAATR